MVATYIFIALGIYAQSTLSQQIAKRLQVSSQAGASTHQNIYQIHNQPIRIVNDDNYYGVDLSLGKLCGSATLGALIEEQLLAKLLGIDTKYQHLVFRGLPASTESLAKDLAELQKSNSLDVHTKDNTLTLLIRGKNQNYAVSIKLRPEGIFGLDKKDLEQRLWKTMLSAASVPKQHIPIDADLKPYQDKLYVWEAPNQDTLFCASSFWVADNDGYKLVWDAQHPTESIVNLLMCPSLFELSIPVELSFVMYGNRIERKSLNYQNLHGCLAKDMKVEVAINPLVKTADTPLANADDYEFLIKYYDPLLGFRHILYGSIDGSTLFTATPPVISAKLFAYVFGDAQYVPQTQPGNAQWQIKIR